MGYHPDVHHRQSNRLRDYDYAAGGAYFITICTHERALLFGAVTDETLRLNEAGEMVRDEWLHTAIMRPRVALDAFVVMPNHFHAVLLLHDVGAHCVRPEDSPRTDNPDARSARLRRQRDSLGSIISGFKSAVTRGINVLHDSSGIPVWQRNYYEHVIRNDADLQRLRDYIAGNPVRWDEDEYR
ncbi:MAG TPA: transposase [Geopsychrobacteraceae bacterium]|jgi:REP element-mobilizing transposase RayT